MRRFTASYTYFTFFNSKFECIVNDFEDTIRINKGLQPFSPYPLIGQINVLDKIKLKSR